MIRKRLPPTVALEVLRLLLLAWLGAAARAEVEVLHYGQYGGLSIVCDRDELILVQSERLGYSTTHECNPSSICAVPYTLVKWYCRGKSSCTGMQVERRPLHKRTCGSDFTNCLRVEYQCVKRSRLIDVCSDEEHQVMSGYLSSPGFPNMYPAHQNCSCVLSVPPGEQLQVMTAFFLLKSSSPCHDWLQTEIDNGEVRRRCGYVPHQPPYSANSIRYNFRSDDYNQGMGFWLVFHAMNRSPVTVKCGRYALPDTTTSTTTTTTTVATTTTTTVATTTPTPTTTTSSTSTMTTLPPATDPVTPNEVTLYSDLHPNFEPWLPRTTVVQLFNLPPAQTRQQTEQQTLVGKQLEVKADNTNSLADWSHDYIDSGESDTKINEETERQEKLDQLISNDHNVPQLHDESREGNQEIEEDVDEGRQMKGKELEDYEEEPEELWDNSSEREEWDTDQIDRLETIPPYGAWDTSLIEPLVSIYKYSVRSNSKTQQTPADSNTNPHGGVGRLEQEAAESTDDGSDENFTNINVLLDSEEIQNERSQDVDGVPDGAQSASDKDIILDVVVKEDDSANGREDPMEKSKVLQDDSILEPLFEIDINIDSKNLSGEGVNGDTDAFQDLMAIPDFAEGQQQEAVIINTYDYQTDASHPLDAFFLNEYVPTEDNVDNEDVDYDHVGEAYNDTNTSLDGDLDESNASPVEMTTPLPPDMMMMVMPTTGPSQELYKLSIFNHVFGRKSKLENPQRENSDDSEEEEGPLQGKELVDSTEIHSIEPIETVIKEDDALIPEQFTENWKVNWQQTASTDYTYHQWPAKDDIERSSGVQNGSKSSEDPKSELPKIKWPSYTDPLYIGNIGHKSEMYITDQRTHMKNYLNREYSEPSAEPKVQNQSGSNEKPPPPILIPGKALGVQEVQQMGLGGNLETEVKLRSDVGTVVEEGTDLRPEAGPHGDRLLTGSMREPEAPEPKHGAGELFNRRSDEEESIPETLANSPHGIQGTNSLDVSTGQRQNVPGSHGNGDKLPPPEEAVISNRVDTIEKLRYVEDARASLKNKTAESPNWVAGTLVGEAKGTGKLENSGGENVPRPESEDTVTSINPKQARESFRIVVAKEAGPSASEGQVWPIHPDDVDWPQTLWQHVQPPDGHDKQPNSAGIQPNGPEAGGRQVAAVPGAPPTPDNSRWKAHADLTGIQQNGNYFHKPRFGDNHDNELSAGEQGYVLQNGMEGNILPNDIHENMLPDGMQRNVAPNGIQRNALSADMQRNMVFGIKQPNVLPGGKTAPNESPQIFKWPERELFRTRPADVTFGLDYVREAIHSTPWNGLRPGHQPERPVAWVKPSTDTKAGQTVNANPHEHDEKFYPHLNLVEAKDDRVVLHESKNEYRKNEVEFQLPVTIAIDSTAHGPPDRKRQNGRHDMATGSINTMATGRLRPIAEDINLPDDSKDVRLRLGSQEITQRPELTKKSHQERKPTLHPVRDINNDKQLKIDQDKKENYASPDKPVPSVHPAIREQILKMGKQGIRPSLPPDISPEKDPDLYLKLKNYMKNLEVEQIKDPNEPVQVMEAMAVEDNLKDDQTKGTGEVNGHTLWVLMIVGIVGWLVFAAVLGLLIYYKRDRVRRNRHIRRLARARNRSNDPSHILFPPLALPASPKSSAFKSSNISRAKSLDSLSSKSSPPTARHEDIRPVLGRNEPRKHSFDYSCQLDGEDRPLPAVPGIAGGSGSGGGTEAEKTKRTVGQNSRSKERGSQMNIKNEVQKERNQTNSNSTYESLSKYADRKQGASGWQRQDGQSGGQMKHRFGDENSLSAKRRPSADGKCEDRPYADAKTPRKSSEQQDSAHSREGPVGKTSPITALEAREDINKRIKPPKVPERIPIFTCSSSQVIFSPPQHLGAYGAGAHDGSMYHRNPGYMTRHGGGGGGGNSVQPDQARSGASRKVHYTVNYMHPSCVPSHPQGVHIPHSFPQATTPFLSPKVSHEDLTASASEQMTTWKSNSTLNTEHGYDTDTIYQCLKKIADSYGNCNVISPTLTATKAYSDRDDHRRTSSDSSDNLPPPLPPAPLKPTATIKQPKKPPRKSTPASGLYDGSINKDSRIGDNQSRSSEVCKINSTERIRKVIPPKATEFTEKLQPELSSILTSRLPQKQANTADSLKVKRSNRTPVPV